MNWPMRSCVTVADGAVMTPKRPPMPWLPNGGLLSPVWISQDPLIKFIVNGYCLTEVEKEHIGDATEISCEEFYFD